MLRNSRWLVPMLAIISLVMVVSGCQKIGWVDQGRVIEYDPGKNTVTMIRDVSTDSKNPNYSHLPPVVYDLPKDPNEMGPAPKIGKRMKLDLNNRQVVIYVPALTNFATINYTLIEQKENVAPKDPLVYDQVTDKAKKFPIVDQYRKTITIYSKRQKTVTTFSVPDEYFALPEDTWDNGDEVRIYWKEPGKASRFMNVTQTDIYKK